MRLSRFLCSTLAGAALALCGMSCKLFDTKCKEGQNCFATAAAFAEGLHGSCTQDAECKAGLYCVARKCAAKGDTPTGNKCRLTAECGDADYCGDQRLCKPAGIATRGGKCQTTGDCRHNLVCEAPDLSQLGQITLGDLADMGAACKDSGTREQGEVCTVISDCLAGLSCLPVDKGGETRCSDPQASTIELPALPRLWTGVACPSLKKGDPAQSFFMVPRGTSKPAEFYSLPFPNDIRRKDGHVDMSGHPIPPDTFGLPYVQRMIDAVGDADGFSTNPVAIFRFSQPYAFGSVACQEGGDKCAVRIVDITPSSPEYGAKASIEWKTTTGPLSNYVCPDWLALRRPQGQPLRAHTTYVALITKDIKVDPDSGGGDYARGADLDALLAASAPSNAELQDAYDAYAPLRAWIADKGEDADNILNAAVFTTQDPEAIVQKLHQKVQSEAAATLSDLIVCDGDNTKSPCEDDTGRGKCSPNNKAYVEIHGRIELPIFQKGTLPYLEPEDGGEIELDSSGAPIVQGHERVCFALAVPTTSPPSDGYPVLLFAHGTGGSFNGEFASGGFAAVAASGQVPSALLAIDMPEHGERRGGSSETPENLFYNFKNPRAARDNVLQGVADLFSLVRWLKQSNGITAADSPTNEEIKLDSATLALMGHSQGATHSALALAYEPSIGGVVLSGNGGLLSASLLAKKSPVDIAAAIPVALLDPDKNFKLAGDSYNAALAILQTVFDRSDPVNFARHLQLQPTTEVPAGRHVFVTYGVGDTYAPVTTQTAYARAARLTVVTPFTDDLNLPTAAAPLSLNETIGGTPRTVGLRQYSPKDGEDGHFVAIEAGQNGRPDVEHFLQQLLAKQAPEIGQ